MTPPTEAHKELWDCGRQAGFDSTELAQLIPPNLAILNYVRNTSGLQAVVQFMTVYRHQLISASEDALYAPVSLMESLHFWNGGAHTFRASHLPLRSFQGYASGPLHLAHGEVWFGHDDAQHILDFYNANVCRAEYDPLRDRFLFDHEGETYSFPAIDGRELPFWPLHFPQRVYRIGYQLWDWQHVRER